MLQIQDNYLEILNFAVTKRKSSKMKIRIMAKALNKSIPTISNFENNKNFDYELLFKYCQVLDIHIFLNYRELTKYDILSK